MKSGAPLLGLAKYIYYPGIMRYIFDTVALNSLDES